MTIFYFVRHGNINRMGDNLDPPLTQTGISQANATAARLADQPIDQVYASPLARAGETAAIIAAPHDLAVIQDARLRERANFGDLPGQTVDEFIAMWERCQRRTDVGSAGRRFVVRLRQTSRIVCRRDL